MENLHEEILGHSKVVGCGTNEMLQSEEWVGYFEKQKSMNLL